jgi:hypothetical protein
MEQGEVVSAITFGLWTKPYSMWTLEDSCLFLGIILCVVIVAKVVLWLWESI